MLATNVAPGARPRIERLAAALAEQKLREERAFLEQDLAAFTRESWSSIDSSQYQSSWALDALCEHLTAVTRGDIKRLLINFPPRCGKSNVASICWPAWTWAQKQQTFLSGPGVQFLCGSYNHALSLKHSNSARRLLTSPFYQKYWGEYFQLMGDQNAKQQYDTTVGGSRIATSVGGTLIGIGGNVVLVDDPHNTETVESDAERETVLRWWREISSTRLNDPKQSAIVVVMQRLHQSDVTGAIVGSDEIGDWTHLMLPMRHVEKRHCVSVLKWSEPDEEGERQPLKTWEDPRSGAELMWPERYGEKEVKSLEAKLGPYMASGRLQQLPEPARGGIIQRDWWELWTDQLFPSCFFTWASADTAYTEKEENDPTGFTVWGLFEDRGNMKIILMDAWRKRLEMHGPVKWEEETTTEEERYKNVVNWQRAAQAIYKRNLENNVATEPPTIDPRVQPWANYIQTGENAYERWPTEPHQVWKYRTSHKWGLCEWMADSCNRFNVSKLLIEGKASGLTAAQELRRLHGSQGWGIETRTPEGDKVARAYAVQSLFSSGLVYAPDREWAQMVIDEAAVFPKGTYKDLTDSMTQALEYVRSMGIFVRPEERQVLEAEMARHRPPLKALYEV